MRTYQCNLISNVSKWLKRKSRKIKDEHLQAALTLLLLDLVLGNTCKLSILLTLEDVHLTTPSAC